MKKQSPVLTDDKTLEKVTSSFERNISIDTQGTCDQQTIFEILIRAAGAEDSIENTCKTLQNAPCGNNIRYHQEKYDDMETLESRLNKTFHDNLPPRIYKGKHCVAIDLNLIPYYGKPTSAEVPYICRSKAKDGTCSFYAYATLYVIKKNKRTAIAITAVRIMTQMQLLSHDFQIK